MSSTMDKQQPQSVHGTEKSRKYGAFQNELYRGLYSKFVDFIVQLLTGSQDGMFFGKMPVVTTDPNQLEEQARTKLPITSFNYVAGGAGERATMDANRLAFRQWKLVPRMLRPTTTRDLTVKLFGETYGNRIPSRPKSVLKNKTNICQFPKKAQSSWHQWESKQSSTKTKKPAYPKSAPKLASHTSLAQLLVPPSKKSRSRVAMAQDGFNYTGLKMTKLRFLSSSARKKMDTRCWW